MGFAQKVVGSDPLRSQFLLALVPLYQGDSGFNKLTLPLKQGESRAKRGRGSIGDFLCKASRRGVKWPNLSFSASC